MRIVHLALGRAVMRGESRNEVAPFKAEPNALVRSLGTVDTKSPEAHPGGSAKRDVETVRAVIMLAFSGQAREEQPEQADEPEGREAYDYRSYLTNSGIGLNTLGAIWIGHTLTTREEVIQRRSRDDPNVHRVSSTN